jgi:hypothetical protein
MISLSCATGLLYDISMKYFLIFFFSLSAMGASDSTNAFEKSYPRDNTFCSYKGKRVEFLIRGGNKFIDQGERGFGELLFYRFPLKKPQLLKLNASRGDTYSLFKGVAPLCSKSHAYQIDSNTMAVLLLKENKPFKETLAIQLVDLKTLLPKDFLITNFETDKATKTEDGFAFRTYGENYNPDFGKIKIEGETFIYQEKAFPSWMEYSSRGFELRSELTFEKFPWKNHFKDKADFFEVTSFSPVDKKFNKRIFYIAVNHKLKKECLLFIESKQKISGQEAWRCQAK